MLNFRPTQVRVPFAYSNLIRTAAFLLVTFISFGAFAQSYTSTFTDPTGNYSTSSPSGGTCVAATLNNASAVADDIPGNYISITGLLNATILCTDPLYSIRAKLNLPSGTTSAPVGYSAGFNVQFNSVLSLSLLESNITLRTYLGNTVQQTVTGGSLLNLSLLSSSGIVPIYFTASQPFDEVELIINGSVLPLEVALDYRIYNAFGTIEVLPVNFGSVAAKIQSGNLNVDWNTISETNNDRFVVQGSKDGKAWIDLGTVATKASGGRSSATINYSFSTPWSGSMIAGFGLLGLLLLPAVRSRLLRVGMLVLVLAAVISCAKEKDGFNELEGSGTSQRPLYVRVAQIDKDGTTTYSGVVTAKP